MSTESSNPEGGTEQEIAKPIWDGLGEFETQDQFIESVRSWKEKVDTLEPELTELRGKVTEIEPNVYRTSDARKFDEYFQSELATGKSDSEARASTVNWFNKQLRSYKDEADKNPLGILLDRESEKYPTIDRSKLEKEIKSRYGLNLTKPDPDDEDAVKEYEERIEIAMTKLNKDAKDAADEMEASKAKFDVHPSIKQSLEQRRLYEEKAKAVIPVFHKAVDAASSFSIEVEGVKLDVKLSNDTVKMMKDTDYRIALDENGQVNPEKVRDWARKLHIAENFDTIAKTLVNQGRELEKGNVLADQRNITEGRSRANGNGSEKSELDKIIELGNRVRGFR